MDHEQAFHSFVVSEKQDRYAQSLRSPKDRKKLVDRLNHNHDFDPRFLLSIPSDRQTESTILELLRTRGAPETCHVISANPQLDGKQMPLVDALAKTVAMGHGTVVSCIPGKLAYYEGEDPGERFLLVRP